MRQLVCGSIVLMLVAFGGRAPSWGQEGPMPQGELRIVDKHPWNWVWITQNVFEHLMALDQHGTYVPRLATRWRWLDDRTLEVHLRQGVRFHNGEIFDAEIVKLNWDDNVRLQQPFSTAFLTFKPGSALEIIDPYTVRFVFPEPDGAALVRLSVLHMANRQFYRELRWGEKHW